MRGVLNICGKLPKKQINQLIRDKKFIDAIVRGRGALSTQKKILSDQRGGFPGILFPLAAQLAAPVIGQLGKASSYQRRVSTSCLWARKEEDLQMTMMMMMIQDGNEQRRKLSGMTATMVCQNERWTCYHGLTITDQRTWKRRVEGSRGAAIINPSQS